MVSCRHVLAIAGLLTVVLSAAPAQALDNLPLPKQLLNRAPTEFVSFTKIQNNTSGKVCSEILREKNIHSPDQRVRAIKEYRQCRSEKVLEQFAAK